MDLWNASSRPQPFPASRIESPAYSPHIYISGHSTVAMDINSLLSPSEERTTLPANASPRKSRKRTSKNATPSSPHSASATSAPLPLHNAALQAQPSPPIPNSTSHLRKHATGTPPADFRTTRQPSTPGMDTLADLASMQHHQQTARENAGGLRSTEIYDPALKSIARPQG